MNGLIVDQHGNPLVSEQPQNQLRARYEAATLTELDERFKLATYNSADATNSPSVRSMLSKRARYEFQNNSYCKGLVARLGYEIIGSGPKLSIDAENEEAANEVEKRFEDHCDASGLCDELYAAIQGFYLDGETFGRYVVDRSIPHTKERLRFYESEYCQDAFGAVWTEWRDDTEHPVDGILFDTNGNPEEYIFWKYHPGGAWGSLGGNGYDSIPANDVIHLYRKDRPGQHRGVSHLAPCLQLFVTLRAYTQATLDAAETAAQIAAVMQTNSPNIDGEVPTLGESMVLSMRRKQIFSLPFGWAMNQFKAEQPVTGYGEFKREILSEIYNAVLTPFSVGASDSSENNFASGMLDQNSFYRIIDAIRSLYLERKILNRTFRRWFYYADLAGIIPSNLGKIHGIRWFYDQRMPLDEAKRANAVAKLDGAGLLDEVEYAAQHKQSIDDWYRNKAKVQRAKERHGIKEPAKQPEENVSNENEDSKELVETEA